MSFRNNSPILESPILFSIWAKAFVLTAFVIVQACFAMNANEGGALPKSNPLFPSDNWWNLDISAWPIDPKSASYIAFINNGGTRRLHPDLGGNANDSEDPNACYGMPYVVVSNVMASDLVSVQFQYAPESDGVNHETETSYPFYPIPREAITQATWVEGGDPGQIDLRDSQDRHLLIVDADRNYLYELYNVFYDHPQNKWYAGSGAFFDMNQSGRRPDTWTSADAAGLAILPGLIRYDEVYPSTEMEIGHAFRVTVRSTDGYVYPASHEAGSRSGALPMGARLRLKSTVNITQRSKDPNIQRVFRAMQKHGLIVADNGSDLYVTGTYDLRWNSDILNPAFRSLAADDFEVIQLGFNPNSTPEGTGSSPQNLRAHFDGNRLSLTWDALSPTANYEVEECEDLSANSAWSRVAQVKANVWNIQLDKTSHGHFYRVSVQSP